MVASYFLVPLTFSYIVKFYFYFSVSVTEIMRECFNLSSVQFLFIFSGFEDPRFKQILGL